MTLGVFLALERLSRCRTTRSQDIWEKAHLDAKGTTAPSLRLSGGEVWVSLHLLS